MPKATGVTAALADLVARTRLEDIPEPVLHEAKRALVNFFAVAFAGSRDTDIDTLAGVLRQAGTAGAATVIGRGDTATMPDAAFLNAASANVHDFDDTHPRTIIHPTAPVAPVLLALAETRALGGKQLLGAFALGVEVECRLGNAVSPGHYRRGWHITASCGVFGAAAAAARVLELDADRTAWALAGAATQAGGLVECLGTGAKSIGVGNAARNGLLAALFAQSGLRGPAEPIEGRFGFLAVASDDPAVAELTKEPGARWELSTNTYKPYPCGVVLNPVIEACLDLRERHAIAPKSVESVVVEGHPLLAERTDRPDVTNGRLSQVSAQHAVAAVLVTGAAGLEAFSDSCVGNPEVAALRARVSVEASPEMAVGAARVSIRGTAGERWAMELADARGSSTRPLSDTDLDAKLARLAGPDHALAQELASLIWRLDVLPDAGAIPRLCRRWP